MKKAIKRFILPLLVMSMALSGCGKTEEETTQEVSLTPVEVQEMSNASIKKELVYAGQVQPNDTVNVTSKLSGLVEKVNYDVGDYVSAGQILFTLDKKDIQDQIKQLEASLKTSDASVKSAQTSLSQAVDSGQIESSRLQLQTAIDTTEKSVETAKIQLDNTKATLDDVAKKYNDTKKLFESGVATRSELDAAELAYTQTQNSYDQVQKQYQQAETSYEQAKKSLEIFNDKTTVDTIESAQNGVNTALASRNAVLTQLQIAKETLNDTSVKAPISGLISAKNISATNMVSSASAPFTIVDMSKVTVEVNVSEKIINHISVGQSVDVVIPTINNDRLTGVIKTISPTADATNTYPVKIEIENSESTIKPGMFAEIHFVESEEENAFVVPRNTILQNDTESYVFIVEDGKAVKKTVETGVDNGEEIQILSGVNAGQQVVVNGQDYVTDGEGVNVVSVDGQPTQTDATNQENIEETTKGE